MYKFEIGSAPTIEMVNLLGFVLIFFPFLKFLASVVKKLSYLSCFANEKHLWALQ